MLGQFDWVPGLGRGLVFGGVAVMGSMLAWAQVAAPQANPGPAGAPQPPATAKAGAQNNAQPLPAAEPAAPVAANAQTRPGLGLNFDPQVKDGLSIAAVPAESAAALAGLRQGDRIVSVDGRQFTTQRQLQAYLSGQYGRRVPVIIDRGGQQYNVQLDIDQAGNEVAWLGVFLQETEDQAGQPAGARITQVYPAGPAARAGLRPGDIVQQMNGQAVAGPAELIGFVEEMKPGAKAELAVLRGEQQVKIPAVLGNRSHFIYHGGQQDEFGGGGRFSDSSEFGNVPPHAMQLEQDRRMAEQHQRIEEELRKLQDEVRKLREALQPRAN